MARTSDLKWVCAGVEVSASRRATWLALCGVSSGTKRVHVHVPDPLNGTAVTGQLVALWEKLSLDGFALDPRSPSATLTEPLKDAGMTLRLADTIGVATAHGMFADLLMADRLRITGHPALDEAVRSAEARRLAGSAAIDRYADGAVDMAPLMAAELSVWMLGDPETAGGLEHVGVWVIDSIMGPGRAAPPWQPPPGMQSMPGMQGWPQGFPDLPPGL